MRLLTAHHFPVPRLPRPNPKPDSILPLNRMKEPSQDLSAVGPRGRDGPLGSETQSQGSLSNVNHHGDKSKPEPASSHPALGSARHSRGAF